MIFPKKLFERELRPSFTTNNKELDRSGHFYHVTQQCYSFGSTFSMNSAKYRTQLLHDVCSKNKVIVLCSVVMPNHTHDVFFSNEFASIQKSLKTVNTAVSKFITKERNFYNKNKIPVFRSLPSYERITEKEHLFYLFKYLYENPAYLKAEDKAVPYSCFDQWEKKNYKPYNKNVYNYLFNKDLSEITDMCVQLTKDQFKEVAKKLYGGQKGL